MFLSGLNIFHPAYSVPSFHIRFSDFKKICDWTENLDIGDRQCCFTKVSSSENFIESKVIGTLFKITNQMWYLFHSDIPHPHKIRKVRIGLTACIDPIKQVIPKTIFMYKMTYLF